MATLVLLVVFEGVFSVRQRGDSRQLPIAVSFMHTSNVISCIFEIYSTCTILGIDISRISMSWVTLVSLLCSDIM